MKTSRVGIAIAVLVGVLAALTLGTAWILGVGPFDSPDTGPVIALVNGRPVYLTEAQARVASLSGVHTQGGSPLAGEDWQDQVLGSLVDDRLIQAEAERMGINVSAQDLASSVQDVIDMFPSLAEYDAWLVSERLDQEEVERRLELQLLSIRVYDALTSDVVVSEEQVRAYYDANPGEFATSDGGMTPFTDARADIGAKLLGQTREAAFTAWLEEQRDSADVEIVMTDWWRDIDEQQS